MLLLEVEYNKLYYTLFGVVYDELSYNLYTLNCCRVIISFRLSMLLPISSVTENMKRAQRRNAVLEQKLFFRKGITTCKTPPQAKNVCNCVVSGSDEVVEMTVNEIING